MTELQKMAVAHALKELKEAYEITTNVYDWEFKDGKQIDFAKHNEKVSTKGRKIAAAMDWLKAIDK